MKLTSVLLFILGLFHITAFAQHKSTLSGEVRDNKGNSISQAMVSLEQSTIGAYSNDKGVYTLQLSSGKHTILVSSFGYKSIKKEVAVENDTKQNFILEEDPIALKAVMVDGKTKVQQIRESVYSVNALDIKSITGDINNLNAIVGRSTGVRIREKGGLGSEFDISLNGLSGNSIRYFIDGVPLSARGNGITLANLPINIVDRIEIYKGVVPASLGADALGGAINIITKRDVKNFIDLSYGIGSFQTHKADMNAQFTDSKTGLTVRPTFGVNYSKNDYKMKGVEVPTQDKSSFYETDVKRFHDDYLSLIGQLEVGVINKSWADALFISAGITSINKELQTGAIQQRVYGEAERDNKSFNLALQYRKKDFLLDKLTADISASYTWDKTILTDTAYRQYRWDGSFINSDRNEIAGRSKSIRHTKRPLTMVRSNFDYQLSETHSFNINYLLNRTGNDRYDELDLDPDFKPSNDIFTKHIVGLSYNQNLLNGRLNNTFFLKEYINHLKVEQQDLAWITGVRDQRPSSTKENLSYGLGTRFRVTEHLAIKGSLEHSIRLPLAQEVLGNGEELFPNLNLKPENSNNLNIGAFGIWELSPKHRLNYETNIFARKVKDYIRRADGQTGGKQYENVASVTVTGIEGEVRYDYNDLLQAIVNCSYIKQVNKTKYQANGKPEITYNNDIPNMPWLFGNAEVNIRQKDLFGQKGNQLKFSYYFQYIHWFYYTWKGFADLSSKKNIPTQCISNIGLSYSFQKEKYNISLECDNIFDRTTYDNFKLQKPGRSFFCKLRLFIN